MHIDNKIKHRAFALAGILQAAELVNELAAYGNYHLGAFLTSIESLYKLEAENVSAVYGKDLKGIELGLATLEKLLIPEKTMLKKLSLRYFFGLLHLERKLYQRRDLQQVLRARIEKVILQTHYFQNTVHPTVIANLADTYVEVLTKFNFRIMLQGEKQHLSCDDNLNKVRAMLLAGIRSTVLWRQLGGNRWQIMLQRKKYLTAVRSLLQQL